MTFEETERESRCNRRSLYLRAAREGRSFFHVFSATSPGKKETYSICSRILELFQVIKTRPKYETKFFSDRRVLSSGFVNCHRFSRSRQDPAYRRSPVRVPQEFDFRKSPDQR